MEKLKYFNKIGDFGVSKIISPDYLIFDKSGTLCYLAPEVVSNNGYQGFSSDIWSIGIVLYAMLHGSVPFKSERPEDLSHLIKEGKLNCNSELSLEVKDLINSLLNKNQEERLKLKDIVCHNWFEDLEKIKINIFTQTEIENIKNGLIISNKAEPEISFIEQNIDKTENELTKNITSKSLMLAPYNTNITDEENDNLIDQNLVRERDTISFSRRVIETNKAYELNNNCEFDNGVYNDNPNMENAVQNVTKKQKDYSKFKTLSSSNKSNNSEKEVNINSSISMYNKRPYFRIEESIDINISQNNLDNEVIEKMEEFGFTREIIIQSMKNDDFNYATSTYFLLCPR